MARMTVNAIAGVPYASNIQEAAKYADKLAKVLAKLAEYRRIKEQHDATERVIGPADTGR